eukprot:TRINITY_DN7254_c0_g1_i1.p1 TRINITY_DN7254_c0_g1~~TRINITY_DN7254_c0_g1_i1.p1  ORF type:complete len:457 (+),score=95.12 TRINITY_DN7254_c0_g1_i1:26-1396(+)
MKEYTLKETLPVTPREFYSLFFEKDDFFIKFHHSIGHKNVEVTSWTQAPEHRQQRTVKYQTLASSPASLLRFASRPGKPNGQDMIPVREIQLAYFTNGEFHCSSMRDSFEFRSEWVVSPVKGGCECKILIRCDYKGVLMQDLEAKTSKQARESYSQLLALALTEAESFRKDRVSQGSTADDEAFLESDSSSFDVAMLNYDSDRSDAESTMSSEHNFDFPLSRNSSEKESDGGFYDAEDTVALTVLPTQIRESAMETVVMGLQNEVTQLRTLVASTYSRLYKLEATIKKTQEQHQSILQQQHIQREQLLQQQQQQLQQSTNSIDNVGRSSSSPAMASQLAASQPPQFYSYYLTRLEDLTKQLDEEQRKRKEIERLLVAKHKDLDAKIRQIRQESHSGIVLSPWVVRGCAFGTVVLLFALTTKLPSASSPANSFLGWLLTPFAKLRDYLQSTTSLLTR